MKIKPLQWVSAAANSERRHMYAKSPWCHSDYWLNETPEGAYHVSLLDYQGGVFSDCAETLEAAQALCQADHERRIRALLEPDDVE